MCGTDTRTELSAAALEQSGCGCCSAGAQTMALPVSEGSVYSIEGLACGHCVQIVEKAVASVDGVESAAVELVAGGTSRLAVTGAASADAVRDAGAGAGYSLTPSR